MRVPQEILDLIAAGALFVCNDSAGKDSQAMKIKLIELVPKDQLVIVHANLPGVEWDGNIEHIQKYAQGVPVHEVQAGKTFLGMVEARGMFPSPSQRQCTSDLKRDPIQKFINKYCKDRGFTQVVNCMGLRADESPARAKKEVFKVNNRTTVKHRQQWEWLPIHDFTIEQVYDAIAIAGQRRHWAYDAGMTRLSCCFCIMASESDLKTAARLKPELAAQYIALEEKINFTMSMSRRPLKDIIGTEGLVNA